VSELSYHYFLAHLFIAHEQVLQMHILSFLKSNIILNVKVDQSNIFKFGGERVKMFSFFVENATKGLC